MKTLLFALSLALACARPASAADADHGFTFTGPKIDGWAQASLDGLGAPPGAVLLHSNVDGSENFNVLVASETISMSAALVSQLKAMMASKMSSSGIADFQALESGKVDIAGVPSFRMVAQATYGGRPKKQLVYILPGKAHYAALTYTAGPERFDALLPAFEESARQTKGLVRHLSFQDRALRGALFGGLVAGLLGLFKKLFGGQTAAA